MSRIGKRPVALPKGVTVTTGADYFEAKGPKGSLRRPLHGTVQIAIKDGAAHVSARDGVGAEEASRMTGTARSHLNNAITGVSSGFARNLKFEGTGYKVEIKGTSLTLSLGLSHPVVYDLPKAVSAKVAPESKNTVLLLETMDKDLLGKVIAQLQSYRPPEPYKGKGVRLLKPGSVTEMVPIRQKAGKAGKGGK
jgi:large subunit ribosomal protein L6